MNYSEEEINDAINRLMAMQVQIEKDLEWWLQKEQEWLEAQN